MCPCREEFEPLVGIDPQGAYGRMHVHRREEPLWEGGIRARDDSAGGVDVVVETDEYGDCLMRPEDRDFIAQSPELVAELVAEVERLRRWKVGDDQSDDLEQCRCDGGAYGPQEHPFIVHPDCPVHGSGDPS